MQGSNWCSRFGMVNIQGRLPYPLSPPFLQQQGNYFTNSEQMVCSNSKSFKPGLFDTFNIPLCYAVKLLKPQLPTLLRKVTDESDLLLAA